jgi:uncharacterized repeat protein (TIGR03803 family)
MITCTGFGAALALAVLIGVSAAATAQETVLYRFQGGLDGANPQGGLVMDAGGNLYGTTSSGGQKARCSGCGTIFMLSPPAAGQSQWTETLIHRFGGEDHPNGTRSPSGVVDADGVLYGTTNKSVFALTPPRAAETFWTEKPLHTFHAVHDHNGASPAGLAIDARGVLYGTTSTFGCGNCSTVFALMPPTAGERRWTHKVLHRFVRFADGQFPEAGLIVGASGVLYGTTTFGGGTGCAPGCGTVFSLSPPAAGETKWRATVLHQFDGTDGYFPSAGLIVDARGVLYGTTSVGGKPGCDPCGTAFALAPPAPGQSQWSETVLYRFSGREDGAQPSTLIADANGVLYGTASIGGGTGCQYPGCGTAFALAPPAPGQSQWSATVLYRFSGGEDGANPHAGLIADGNGVLYGTTYSGGGTGCGGQGCGTVFKLVP